MDDGLTIQLNQLIYERMRYENELYDVLITNNVLNDFIPDDFWEPVRVSLPYDDLNKLKSILNEAECFICRDTKQLFTCLWCCSKHICNDCTFDWFCISVYCPYCKKDLRNSVD